MTSSLQSLNHLYEGVFWKNTKELVINVSRRRTREHAGLYDDWRCIVSKRV